MIPIKETLLKLYLIYGILRLVCEKTQKRLNLDQAEELSTRILTNSGLRSLLDIGLVSVMRQTQILSSLETVF